MIAEKFVEAQIFLPFPEFLPELDKQIHNISKLIGQLRMNRNVGCTFGKTNATDLNGIAESWLLKHVIAEYDHARADLTEIRLEMHDLMREPRGTNPTRTKRVVTLLAAGATAALFGLGIGIGTRLNCGLKGIFGSCPDMTKENKVNIKKSISHINKLQDSVMEIQQNTSNKMFLVASHLSQITKSQQQFENTQAQNWRTIQEHLDIIHQNTVEWGDCQQSLFMRTKILHQALGLSNILGSMLTTIKTYRTALYAYRLNTLAAFAVAVDHFIPLSLVPKKHLVAVLTSVAQEQEHRGSRMQLAIPISEILGYYETKILTAVRTNELGLLLVIAVPMTRQPVAMIVYRGHHIPMPLNDSDTALKWNLETEYIAVTDTNNEMALMTHHQLKRCIGSQSLALCYEVMPTITTRHTCIATLFFAPQTAALRACTTETISLPMHEQASHLGGGKWLLLSRRPNFTLKEYSMNETVPRALRTFEGCKSCTITVACHTYIEGPNIRLRPDFATCTEAPTNGSYHELTSALNHIFAMLPGIEQLPQFAEISMAQTTLLRRVQAKLIHLPMNETPSTSDLEAIAAPLVHSMTHLHPIHEHNKFYNAPWFNVLIFSVIILAILILVYCHVIHPKVCRTCAARQQILRPPTVRFAPQNDVQVFSSYDSEPMLPTDVQSACDMPLPKRPTVLPKSDIDIIVENNIFHPDLEKRLAETTPAVRAIITEYRERLINDDPQPYDTIAQLERINHLNEGFPNNMHDDSPIYNRGKDTEAPSNEYEAMHHASAATRLKKPAPFYHVPCYNCNQLPGKSTNGPQPMIPPKETPATAYVNSDPSEAPHSFSLTRVDSLDSMEDWNAPDYGMPPDTSNKIISSVLQSNDNEEPRINTSTDEPPEVNRHPTTSHDPQSDTYTIEQEPDTSLSASYDIPPDTLKLDTLSHSALIDQPSTVTRLRDTARALSGEYTPLHRCPIQRYVRLARAFHRDTGQTPHQYNSILGNSPKITTEETLHGPDVIRGSLLTTNLHCQFTQLLTAYQTCTNSYPYFIDFPMAYGELNEPPQTPPIDDPENSAAFRGDTASIGLQKDKDGSWGPIKQYLPALNVNNSRLAARYMRLAHALQNETGRTLMYHSPGLLNLPNIVPPANAFNRFDFDQDELGHQMHLQYDKLRMVYMKATGNDTTFLNSYPPGMNANNYLAEELLDPTGVMRPLTQEQRLEHALLLRPEFINGVDLSGRPKEYDMPQETFDGAATTPTTRKTMPSPKTQRRWPAPPSREQQRSNFRFLPETWEAPQGKKPAQKPYGPGVSQFLERMRIRQAKLQKTYDTSLQTQHRRLNPSPTCPRDRDLDALRQRRLAKSALQGASESVPDFLERMRLKDAQLYRQKHGIPDLPVSIHGRDELWCMQKRNGQYLQYYGSVPPTRHVTPSGAKWIGGVPHTYPRYRRSSINTNNRHSWTRNANPSTMDTFPTRRNSYPPPTPRRYIPRARRTLHQPR